MTLTKPKIALLLLSSAGALFASHKHQQHMPGAVHTMSAVTVTGAATNAKSGEAKVDPPKPAEEPCVCPPAAAAADDFGQR